MKKIGLVFLLNILLLNLAIAAGCVNWPHTSFQPIPNIEGKIAPDMGIYWFNTNIDNTPSQQRVMSACRTDNPIEKAICLAKLKNTGYFDPAKPTIIFIHGWQPDSSAHKQRFDLCYSYPISQTEMSPIYNTLQYWRGWNVGVFYWTQFADEPDVLDAEAKIYSTQGKQGMRWSYLNNKGQINYCDSASLHCAMPLNPSYQVADVLEMLEASYRQALPNVLEYHGSELRIAGQSLGAQLAIQLADYVLSHRGLPQPTRLSLMDPYFSPNIIKTNSENLPLSVADYNTMTVDLIEQKRGHLFPIDVYRTSTFSYFPFGNPGDLLIDKIAYMRLYPKYFYQNFPAVQEEGLSHIASIYLYFESKKHLPVYLPNQPDTAYVNAAADDQQVIALMTQKRYQQASNAETHFPDTQDEIFSNLGPVREPEYFAHIPK